MKKKKSVNKISPCYHFCVIENKCCAYTLIQFLFIYTECLSFFLMLLEEIVHPKIESLSTFTHSHVIPTCMSFLLMLNIKVDILKNAGNKKVAGPH